jgi:hypothetical protein
MNLISIYLYLRSGHEAETYLYLVSRSRMVELCLQAHVFMAKSLIKSEQR